MRSTILYVSWRPCKLLTDLNIVEQIWFVLLFRTVPDASPPHEKRTEVHIRYSMVSFRNLKPSFLTYIEDMIWLLPHPPPTISRQQAVSLSQSSCMSPVELLKHLILKLPRILLSMVWRPFSNLEFLRSAWASVPDAYAQQTHQFPWPVCSGYASVPMRMVSMFWRDCTP
jgi:hypothetical protein